MWEGWCQLRKTQREASEWELRECGEREEERRVELRSWAPGAPEYSSCGERWTKSGVLWLHSSRSTTSGVEHARRKH